MLTGTAGLWRRSAIDDAGGWHADTLTEDLDLSYRALLGGWRFIYLIGQAAPAELPADMNAFKSQQFRWAKGSIQVARKLLPRVVRAPLPVPVKLEAWFHLTQNLPYLLTALLMLLLVPALLLRPASAAEVLWLHVPALVLTTLTLGAYYMTSQRALSRSCWLAVAHLPALIAITAGICLSQARAVLEGLLGRESAFVRTPKQGLVGSARRRSSPSIYRGVRDLVVFAELGTAIMFAVALVAAVAEQRWMVAPVLLVLGGGFAYVGACSALRR